MECHEKETSNQMFHHWTLVEKGAKTSKSSPGRVVENPVKMVENV